MSKSKHALKYYITYPLQAVFVALIYGFFRLLPVSIASAIGSLVGRTIGPRLSITKRARRNLTTVFPEKSAAGIQAIIIGMWDNLGRTAAEYPHVSNIDTTKSSGLLKSSGAIYLSLFRLRAARVLSFPVISPIGNCCPHRRRSAA